MSKIIISSCECCGSNRTAVRAGINASGNSYKICKVCDPSGFEEQARLDIEAWLRGDAEAGASLG